MFRFHALDPGETPGDSNEAGEEQANLDMILAGIDTGRRLDMVITYYKKLFRRETIERYIDYFRKIVSAVLENEAVQLKDIHLTTHLVAADKNILANIESEFEF
jgi:hypothetical protein